MDPITIGLIIAGLVGAGAVVYFWDIIKKWAKEVIKYLGVGAVVVYIYRKIRQFYVTAKGEKNGVVKSTTSVIAEEQVDADVLRELSKYRDGDHHRLKTYSNDGWW